MTALAERIRQCRALYMAAAAAGDGPASLVYFHELRGLLAAGGVGLATHTYTDAQTAMFYERGLMDGRTLAKLDAAAARRHHEPSLVG